jgi:hypothetical protein
MFLPTLGLSIGQYLCCASDALLTDRRIYGRAGPCGCRWKGCPEWSSPCSRDGHTVKTTWTLVEGAKSVPAHPCPMWPSRQGRQTATTPTLSPRCNAANTPKITLQRNETKRTWLDWARDGRRYPDKMPSCVKVGRTKRADVWQISGRCSADA